jgi:cell division septal protein FtsQ
VEVSRHFPNRLRINIAEVMPICEANIDGLYYLIDDRGKVIDSNYEGFGLPIAMGLVHEKLELGRFIQDEETLNNFAIVCGQIIKHDLQERIREFDFTEKTNIKFKLDNIDVQIGDNSRMEYKFMILMEIYQQLLPNIKGELDIRNGSKAHFREIYN